MICVQHVDIKYFLDATGAKIVRYKKRRFDPGFMVDSNSIWQTALNKDLGTMASNKDGSTIFDVFNFA